MEYLKKKPEKKPLFDEKSRKDALADLEERRVKFIESVKNAGIAPEKSLYIQREGGFWGFCVMRDKKYLIYGAGPAEDKDFYIEDISDASIIIEDIYTPSKGLGGVLGFGTRGGSGVCFTITRADGTSLEVPLLGALGAALDIDGGGRFFDTKINRRTPNFAWNLEPVSPAKAKKIGLKWKEILGAEKLE